MVFGAGIMATTALAKAVIQKFLAWLGFDVLASPDYRPEI